MQTPGFTATASLSQIPRDGAGRARMPVLAAQPAVVPAQVDRERVSRLLSSKGGPRWLWEDQPTCPLGQKALWVSRGLTEKCCDTVRRVWDRTLMQYVYVPAHVCDFLQCGGFEPAFTGWECQDVRLWAVP